MESNPFGDADDTLFEQEEYNAVSALLGERAKPFLGIPTGPIQVGHFIGALGIVLMAFVDYPGFPLTNLPTPVRECFQGGRCSPVARSCVQFLVLNLTATSPQDYQLSMGSIRFSPFSLFSKRLSEVNP